VFNAAVAQWGTVPEAERKPYYKDSSKCKDAYHLTFLNSSCFRAEDRAIALSFATTSLNLLAAERAVQVGTNGAHGSNSGNGDQSSDQAVFDCGRAIFVSEQVLEKRHVRSPELAPHAPLTPCVFRGEQGLIYAQPSKNPLTPEPAAHFVPWSKNIQKQIFE
jgi:hypothetical protein